MLTKALSVVVIGVFGLLVQPAIALGAGWDFTGSWRVDVKCKTFEHVNNVTIGRADKSKVTGTTNVNDGFGKITGGTFDGVSFVFTNKYKYDGRNYTETWTGKLSNGGKSLKGKFDTTNTAGGGCSYRGTRQ